MDLGVSGKVAVVAGASGGLGSAIAVRLAEEGMSLALVGRDQTRLAELAERLGARNATALAVATDTTDQASVQAMARSVEKEFGRCDVIVNAAAPPALSKPNVSITDTSAAEILEDFNVKVLGAFRCIQALVPLMTATGGGQIVTISGLNARRTGSLSGSIRNVALSAMTKNLADELGPSGIRLTVVHPGVVDSPAARARLAVRAEAAGRTVEDVVAETAAQSSLHRLATPDAIADIVAFLASERSVAITGDSIAAGCGERGVIHY